MLAMLRDHMDGYVGMAFGYQREDLSVRVQRFGLNRQERIEAIVRALAVYLLVFQHIPVARAVGDHEIPQVGGVGDQVIPHPAVT